MKKKKSSEFLTYSGQLFDPLNPNPRGIRIEDIAHALSNVCRYNGHIRDFYSVAQHVVIVSNIAESFGRLYARAALIHDASEAYICDVVNPVKQSDAFVEFYIPIEERLQAAIFKKLGVPEQLLYSYPVVLADKLCYYLERLSMFPDHPETVDTEDFEKLVGMFGDSWRNFRIKPFEPYVAKSMFLSRFEELYGSNGVTA